MKLLPLAFFTALILAAPVRTSTASQCAYDQIQEVSHIPPTRSQDSTEFCYGFAAINLIQQLYCKEKPGGCKYSEDLAMGEDDRLSVLDAIATGNGTSLKNGGFVSKVLEKAGKQGSLAKEQCASFDSWANAFDSKPALRGGVDDWFDELVSLRKWAKNVPMEAACPWIQRVEESYPLSPSAAKLLESIRDKRISDREFVTRLALPEECRKNRVSIPKFQVKSFRGSRASEVEKIKELIGHDIPVSVNLCPTMSCRDGSHFFNIVGKRRKCCNGKCEEEFRILDSTGNWFNEPPGAEWMSVKRFSKYPRINDSPLDIVNRVAPKARGLHWIEGGNP